MTRIWILVALLAGTLLPSLAFAESGVVTGRLKYWQANGGYCPLGNTCTGARYTWASFNHAVDFANGQVFIENDTVGIIGSGTTDTSGNFSVSWSYSGTVPNKSQTKVWWRPYHKDGRFRINTSSGSYPTFSSYFTLTTGTKPLGNLLWGSSLATSNRYANAYWAAEVAWRQDFSIVGLFVSEMTDIQIRGFADEIWEDCPTGCFLPGQNRIQLSPGGAYNPTNVMHELGHAATYTANGAARSARYQYCKTEENSDGCTWSATSNEWAATAFHEAYAELAPMTALYTAAATAPQLCGRPQLACQATDPNLETSSGSSCSGTEKYWPLTMMRFFWDVYDANDGIALGAWENYWKMWQIWEEYYLFGCGDNSINEPFESIGFLCDIGADEYAQPDTRGAQAYTYHMDRVRGVDLTSARQNNCYPL